MIADDLSGRHEGRIRSGLWLSVRAGWSTGIQSPERITNEHCRTVDEHEIVMNIELPLGWSSWGSLLDFDPTTDGAAGIRRSELVEDLWVARAPGDSVIVHLGWYPHGDPTGSFAVNVVRDGDWEHPVEVLSIQNSEQLVAWLVSTVQRYDRMVGTVFIPRAARRRALNQPGAQRGFRATRVLQMSGSSVVPTAVVELGEAPLPPLVVSSGDAPRNWRTEKTSTFEVPIELQG
jgi:hypothetical protein